jgi:4-oxalocrotonate tautomerase
MVSIANTINKLDLLFLLLFGRYILMPYVTVKMLEGRTEEQKRNLVEKVTAVVSETTGAPVENVVVFIEDMPRNHYAVAGVRLSDK